MERRKERERERERKRERMTEWEKRKEEDGKGIRRVRYRETPANKWEEDGVT